MEEEWGSPKFVAEQFQRWYAQHSHTIPAPIELPQREFAFLNFFGRGMHRHIKLPTLQELQRYLRQNAPAHSYHSSGYYDDPTADMTRKGWLGADLVFDIDADHFELPCQKVHDKWWCRNCDEQGTGHLPEICKCGKAQFTTETWICEKCLQAAKHETHKLLDILIQDFGVHPDELITNFSGNRGYHVHVHNNDFKTLNQHARREIVDYIMAIGLEPEFQGFSQRNRGTRSTLAMGGWRGRTGRALYDYISEAKPEEIKKLKLGRKASSNIINNKEQVLETLMERHPSNITPLIDPKSLKTVLNEALGLQASEIDTVVTTDIHRLIRLPNTLHGKTGWQVQTIPYGALPDYDPLVKSVVMSGSPVKLEFKRAPKIQLKGEGYGPYNEEEVTLPMEAALFYLCKKGARVKNE
ncbi:MAG: DNA primase small subunit PriS [Candidatus Bathyarchaeota archaeon]|nr:DNA primase small subunit PriS [Candidatus Bathyarchaeota archaeon]